MNGLGGEEKLRVSLGSARFWSGCSGGLIVLFSPAGVRSRPVGPARHGLVQVGSGFVLCSV